MAELKLTGGFTCSYTLSLDDVLGWGQGGCSTVSGHAWDVCHQTGYLLVK